MKTYEEMANSALERIHKHKKAQRSRNKTILKIVAPTLCLALILSVIAFNNGLFTNPQMNLNDTEKIDASSAMKQNDKDKTFHDSISEKKSTKNTKTKDKINDVCDMLGSVTVEGRFYIQWMNADADNYTKGKYLGKASDYEGFYKEYCDIQGDLYCSAEDEKILLVYLENDTTIVLKQDFTI